MPSWHKGRGLGCIHTGHQILSTVLVHVKNIEHMFAVFNYQNNKICQTECNVRRFVQRLLHRFADSKHHPPSGTGQLGVAGTSPHTKITSLTHIRHIHQWLGMSQCTTFLWHFVIWPTAAQHTTLPLLVASSGKCGCFQKSWYPQIIPF